MIRWPNHRWFRFSLRTLFVLVALAGVALAWRTQPPLLITLDTPRLDNCPIYGWAVEKGDDEVVDEGGKAKPLDEDWDAISTPARAPIIEGYEPGWFRVPARLTNVSRSNVWFAERIGD